MSKFWTFKVVDDDKRSYQTVDTYDDSFDTVYHYDSNVPNNKRVESGDFVLIVDKVRVLGFAQIEKITRSTGKKNVKNCPHCGSSAIDKRKKLKPVYRCNRGHIFDIPKNKIVSVKKFSAHYSSSFISINNYPIELIKKDFEKYNQNNSIQLLKTSALDKFASETYLYINIANNLNPEEAESEYKKTDQDTRDIVDRQIKQRRGQKKFRNALRRIYGDQCMITGCSVLDILEAAHINPYKGKNDNHPSNGLLLRSDIHTLYDLNLMGIEPTSLEIHFHPRVLKEYDHLQKKTLKNIINRRPDKAALERRWSLFTKII